MGPRWAERVPSCGGRLGLPRELVRACRDGVGSRLPASLHSFAVESVNFTPTYRRRTLFQVDHVPGHLRPRNLRLGPDARKKASAFIARSITGGARMPTLMGRLGDLSNKSFSFLMMVVGCALSADDGFFGSKLSKAPDLRGVDASKGHGSDGAGPAPSCPPAHSVARGFSFGRSGRPGRPLRRGRCVCARQT